MRETRPPSPNDPIKRHVDTTRAQLRAEGLPASAPDVRVVVSDSDPRGHGNGVLRAAVGPVGPGQGAESHVQVPHTSASMRSMTAWSRAVATGSTASAAAASTFSYVQDDRSELGRVRELARQDPSWHRAARSSTQTSRARSVARRRRATSPQSLA